MFRMGVKGLEPGMGDNDISTTTARTRHLIIVVLRRVLPVLAAWLLALAPPVRAADAPQLMLSRGDSLVNLAERMAAQRVPVDAPVDPDALWQGLEGVPGQPQSQALAPAARWQARAGERIVGRITLTGGREGDVYVVQVPLSAVDEVQVWFREQGGAWKSGVGGDRVALSRWPFAGQYPAVPVPVHEAPVDLLVTLANDGAANTPVWIMADPAFREVQVRQANLSGLIMGLGLMVVVVTVIAAMLLHGRVHWLLAGVAAWTQLTVICLNGYMAVWFTPEWPQFNDGCKHFAAVVLAGLIVSLTANALDQRFLSRGERWLKWLAPLAGVLYAGAQAAWLPGGWRPPGVFLWACLTLLACLVMCVLNALQGGRYARWIAAAVACFGLSVVLVYVQVDYVAGLDIRSATVGALLFACSLLFRQALFARERYGRDVLGRAAIAANRDPLTALLSYQGFQQAYDEALLKQGAGHGQASVMLFWMPGLEKSGADHGFVLTERAIVRFAASLQGVLGDAWSIGRLSKTRFACIGIGAASVQEVQTLATQVLANCTRQTDPVGPVSDFDLKIACTHRRLAAEGLKPLLFELEEAARGLVLPKRIVMAP